MQRTGWFSALLAMICCPGASIADYLRSIFAASALKTATAFLDCLHRKQALAIFRNASFIDAC